MEVNNDLERTWKKFFVPSFITHNYISTLNKPRINQSIILGEQRTFISTNTLLYQLSALIYYRICRFHVLQNNAVIKKT
jgi:hypothetical protein